MLPAFIDNLDAVAVRVEEISRVVARVVINTRARGAVVGGAGSDGGVVRGVDLSGAIGDETDMRGSAVNRSFPKPEKNAAVDTESFEIGMTWRPILAVVVDAMGDPQRLECRALKRYRSVDISD